jgi:hypothetical protein
MINYTAIEHGSGSAPCRWKNITPSFKKGKEILNAVMKYTSLPESGILSLTWSDNQPIQ